MYEWERLNEEIAQMEMVADDMLDSAENSKARKMLEYLEIARDYLNIDNLEKATQYLKMARDVAVR